MSQPKDRYIGVRPTQKMEHTLPNGRTLEFGIEYNPSNGNVRLRPRGVGGATTILGVHSGDYLNESNGTFTSLANNAQIDQNTQTEFLKVIKESVTASHQQGGGNANNYVLASWINPTEDPNNVEKPTSGKSKTNDKDQSKTSAETTGGGAGDAGVGKLLGNSNIGGFTVTERTIRALVNAEGGKIQYPKDAMYSKNEGNGYNQDHVRITQYTYKAPKASLVGQGGGKQKALDIATKGLQRQSPLEKYLGMCLLPMPNDVTDSNNVAWGQDTISNFQAAAVTATGRNLGATATGAVVGKIAAGNAGGQVGAWGGILSGMDLDMNAINQLSAENQQGIRAALQSRVLAAAGVQISAEAILARGLGIIPNANMELLFQAPALREFQFSWKLTPRGEAEAVTIRRLIRFFKQGMAARKVGQERAAGGASLFLKTPNVFHVQYRTDREDNMPGVNRIKTCALTGTSVNYTPEGIWSAYEEGQPVAAVMSLRFQELEPLYDTDYQETVLQERLFDESKQTLGPILSYNEGLGDLYRIERDEVGY